VVSRVSLPRSQKPATSIILWSTAGPLHLGFSTKNFVFKVCLPLLVTAVHVLLTCVICCLSHTLISKYVRIIIIIIIIIIIKRCTD
jgi:hypothetical protein